MKRRVLSLLSALLCLSLLFCALTSCQPDEQTPEESDSVSDSGTTTEEVKKEYTLNLVVGGKSDYMIIIPEECTQEMISSANNMISAFKNYTGADLDYDRDFLGWGVEPDPEAREILIGNTNRPESAQAIEGLSFGEYTIMALGNKLVINGVGDSAIIAAVDYFITNLVKGNKDLKYGATDANFTFTTAQDYLKESNYYIKSITLLGKDAMNARLVYPEGEYVEQYIALLLKKHITTYAGFTWEVVSDKEAAAGTEILIGKTNRTTISAEAGKYNIAVTEKGLEAVSDTIFGYVQLFTKMQSEVLKYAQENIVLEAGQTWTGATTTPDNLTKDSSVRVMYHNTWGYMNPDGSNPVANRLKVATQIYEAYMPDVIGFQEARTGFEDIQSWLRANGYAEKVAFSGNPVWYNTNTLELLDSGSENAAGHSYNTYWCIFKIKATGKVFGFTNSHFTANSMVTGQTQAEGDIARQEDAAALLRAVEKIQSSSHGGTDIPIICGGDYNTSISNTPYATLIAGGLTNMRDLATESAQVSCHHGGFNYDENHGIYNITAATTSSVASAIDHIMLGGAKNTVTVDEYAVCSDRLSSVTSDHCPHFVDITFQ